jgi:hypothetical protein
MRKVKEILTQDSPALLDPETDARIRAEFPGMVSGEFTPPEGWSRVAATGGDEESGLRRRRRHERAAVSGD